jgi:hypothetical protein
MLLYHDFWHFSVYSNVHIGKHLLAFLSKIFLKHGNVLSPLIFNFAVEYVIMKDHDNQVGLKFNATHQLLAYADDASLLEII